MTDYKKYTKSPSDTDFSEDFLDALGRGQILIHISGENKTVDMMDRPVYLGAYTLSDWGNPLEEVGGHDLWRRWCDEHLDVRDWGSLMEIYNYDGPNKLKTTVKKFLHVPNFIDVRVQPMGSIEFGAFYVSRSNEGWFREYLRELGKTEHHGLVEWYDVNRNIKDVLLAKVDRNNQIKETISKQKHFGNKIYVLRKGNGAYWTGGHTTFTELMYTTNVNPNEDVIKVLGKTSGIAFRREMEEELGDSPSMEISKTVQTIIPGKFNLVILSPSYKN